jgi:hypothetical protein
MQGTWRSNFLSSVLGFPDLSTGGFELNDFKIPFNSDSMKHYIKYLFLMLFRILLSIFSENISCDLGNNHPISLAPTEF